MEDLLIIIENSKKVFKDRLLNLEAKGGLTIERYSRFLQFQFHLTKNVQEYFLAIASSSKTLKKKQLRNWLIQFANEEELHYQVAESDLRSLGKSTGECPLDVHLWHLFFQSTIKDRPFLRLGAACILENIASDSISTIDKLVMKQDFLNKDNLKFLTIHKHGPNLDHGNQILDIINKSDFSEDEIAELRLGARIGLIFYMRFVEFSINGELV